MAKKSTNTQGNPWHSEENGQFVSKNEVIFSTENEEQNKAFEILGVNNNNEGEIIKNFSPETAEKIKKWKQLKNNDLTTDGFEKAKSVSEGITIGNKILGRNVCYYSPSTNIEAVNQLNRALFDINKDFGEILYNLFTYQNTMLDGTKLPEIQAQIREDAKINVQKIAKILGVESTVCEEFLKTKTFSASLDYLIGRKPPKGSTLGEWGGIYGPQGKGRGGASIYINPEITNKNTPGDKVYYVATHELGHQVHMSMYFNILSASEKKELNEIILETMAEGTTWYGQTDRDECAAEAVADYYSNNGNCSYPGHKKIVDYLLLKYKKYFKN